MTNTNGETESTEKMAQLVRKLIIVQLALAGVGQHVSKALKKRKGAA